MAIPHYQLDDRSFDDLVNELVARIPAHAPEWTNPQQGDPGRTIIDLFAWLGDTLLYRINLLPERQRLEFLRLLNIPMRPALAAHGLVSLEATGKSLTKTMQVPLHTTVKGPVDFETTDQVIVFPVSGRIYAKREPTTAEKQAFAVIHDQLEDVYSIQRGATGQRGSEPYVTTPLYEELPHTPDGFDFVKNTIDHCAWIALLVPPGEQDNKAMIKSLFAPDQYGAKVLSIGIKPRITVPAFAELTHQTLDMKESWQWSVATTRESGGPVDPYTVPYLPLEIQDDSTNGFSREGVVELRMPVAEQIGLPANSVDDDIYAGTGNRPPRIDDEEIAGRLLTWIRLRPKQISESLALTWLGINTVPVDQRKTVRNVVISKSNGFPDQSIQLPAGSIESETFELQVEESGKGYQTWLESPLHAADYDDRAYELDAENGTLKFGDGVRGMVPDAGSRIRIKMMRYGGGRQGNIPAGNLGTITHPGLKLTQPIDTTEGVDAETLDQAEKRIPSVLKHGQRAVTEDDYRQLSLYVPGVEVGRVEVLPKFKPQQRLSGVTGVMSVMVLPKGPAHLPPNPRPDRSMLNRVHAYLDRRRPIGVELYVIGTEYIPLGLSTSVTVRDGFTQRQVLQNVANALRDYLWPLPPGGSQQSGWPLGQAVNSNELEVVVARVAGVRTVKGVNIFRKNNLGQWQLHTVSAVSLTLEDWQLPELLAVSVVDGEELPQSLDDEADAGTGISGTDGDAGPSTVVIPIPVVPESCQ